MSLTVLLRDDHAEEALLAHEVPGLLGQVPVLGNLVVVQHLAQLFHLASTNIAPTSHRTITREKNFRTCRK